MKQTAKLMAAKDDQGSAVAINYPIHNNINFCLMRYVINYICTCS